jgi:hypothetical protein
MVIEPYLHNMSECDEEVVQSWPLQLLVVHARHSAAVVDLRLLLQPQQQFKKK